MSNATKFLIVLTVVLLPFAVVAIRIVVTSVRALRTETRGEGASAAASDMAVVQTDHRHTGERPIAV